MRRITLFLIHLSFAAQLGAVTAALPFGSHAFTYATHIKPSTVTQAQMETATKTFYDNWRNAYRLDGCTAGHVRINYDGANQTVSEAHGYGMLIFVLMAGYDANAKTYFDGMYQYYKAHPAAGANKLLAWKQNSSCANIEGDDTASDGDLDVAMALLMADRQWGSCGTINYKAEGVAMVNQIKQYDCNSTVKYVKLGNWATSGNFLNSTRSSDFMPSHYRSYQWATGDAAWTGLINHTYFIVTATANASTGLIPDFIASPLSGPYPAPANFLESPDDGAYNWNACRDPWRLATDYLASGDARAQAACQKMATWLKGAPVNGNPANVRAGYQLGGTQLVSYGDRAFTVPFALAAMVDPSNQTLLNSFWANAQVSGTNAVSYFGDSIKLLCMIVLSGNWWQPEAMPDPCVVGTPSLTSSLTSTPTRTATRTATPSASPTRSGTPTPSGTPSATASYTPSPVLSPSFTRTSSSTASPSPSRTPTPSATRSPSLSPTPSGSSTISETWTPVPAGSTDTATATASSSESPSPSSTQTATGTRSPTLSSSATPSASPSASSTASPSASFTFSPGSTATRSSTSSPTPSLTPTSTITCACPAPSATNTPSRTASPSPSASATASVSSTPSPTPTPTPTPTSTITCACPAPSATSSATPSSTPSFTPTTGAAEEGELKIRQVWPVPNPNPRELVVELMGSADALEARLYSAAMARVAMASCGPRQAGYARLALDLDGLGNGTYYVVVKAKRGGKESAHLKPAKLQLSR